MHYKMSPEIHWPAKLTHLPQIWGIFDVQIFLNLLFDLSDFERIENKQAKIKKGFQTFSVNDLEKEGSESELNNDTDDITEDETDVEKQNKKTRYIKKKKKDIIKWKRGKSTTQKNSPIKSGTRN